MWCQRSSIKITLDTRFSYILFHTLSFSYFHFSYEIYKYICKKLIVYPLGRVRQVQGLFSHAVYVYPTVNTINITVLFFFFILNFCIFSSAVIFFLQLIYHFTCSILLFHYTYTIKTLSYEHRLSIYIWIHIKHSLVDSPASGFK